MVKYFTVIFIVFLLLGCEPTPPKINLDDYYSIRISSLLNTEELADLKNFVGCKDLVIFQPSSCRTCHKDVVEELRLEENSSQERIFLVVTDEDHYVAAVSMGLIPQSDSILYITPDRSRRFGYNAMSAMGFIVCDGEVQSFRYLY